MPLDARAVCALARLRLIVIGKNADGQSITKELWFMKKKTAAKITDFTKKSVERKIFEKRQLLLEG